MIRAQKGIIRERDVLVIPINNTKISGNKLFRLILAAEEVTGYSFRIGNGQGKLYERDGVLYLRVISPQATLEYEQDKALEIPQGNWMIHIIQREYPSDDNEPYFLHVPLFLPTIKCIIDFRSIPDSQSSSLNDHSLSSNLSDEIKQLAEQVDAEYWEKLVTDAEKRREYLECLQKKQTENQAQGETVKISVTN